LRRAVPPVEANPAFAHRLRRALLDSDYYQQPPIVRWLRSTLRLIPVAAGALSVGFLAAVGLGASPATPPSAVPAPAVTVVNPASLERLSQAGQLDYLAQESNGVRVYRLQLASGEILELLDHAPYIIHLTNQGGQ